MLKTYHSGRRKSTEEAAGYRLGAERSQKTKRYDPGARCKWTVRWTSRFRRGDTKGKYINA